MKNKNFKRVLSMMCAIAMLLSLIPATGMAAEAVAATNTLTFSDFGVDDMTHVKDAYTSSGLPEGTSLDGKTFEGYFTMSAVGSAYHSVRIGTTALTGTEAFNGIGIRAHTESEWQIRNFNVAGDAYNGTDLVSRFNIADYGITYADGYFSEVKLTMSWDYVEGTSDVNVVIKLNDIECFNGVVAGLQNNIGTKIYIRSQDEKTIRVRSVSAKPVVGSINNMTFKDVGYTDGTFTNPAQVGGTFSNVTTGADLDGIAFNGSVTLGKPASGSQPMRYQSVRIGGTKPNNGIGFTPYGEAIYLYHYTGDDAGVVLTRINAAAFGVAYDETNGYEAFDFSILYQNIPGTTNTWLTVTINNEVCYEGVIANGQNVLGNRAWLFAYTSPIAIASFELEDTPAPNPEDATFTGLTFADFGVDNMIHNKDAYTSSGLPEGTSLDGQTFEGYFTMSAVGSAYHSVRIGTTALTGTDAFNGIGIRAHSTTEWQIRNFNVAGNAYNGTDLVTRFNIADYGITYADGYFSEVKLSISWDYIEGTSDVNVVIKLNGIECFNGVVAGLQNNIGNKIYIRSEQEKPIRVRSVIAPMAEPSVKEELTFTDMLTSAGEFDTRWEDGAKNKGSQIAGYHPNVTTGADLDGIAFSGNIALGLPGSPLRYQSIRIGGSAPTNGIGFTPIANGIIRLYHYSAEDKGIILKEINAANYGISYDETNGYGAFDFRITYQNVPNSADTFVTVTINNRACYEGVIANGQTVLGNRAWLFAHTSPITITSTKKAHVCTPSEAVKENEKAATCTVAGSYESVVYCADCGKEISRQTVTVNALGHTAGDPVGDNEVSADCVNGGSYDNVVYCTVCGEEISRETIKVDALGHKYNVVVTAPTCVAAGYTTYTCTVCGDTYTGDEVPATGEHTYVDGTCTGCGAAEEVAPTIDENLTIVGKDMLLGGYIGAQFTVNPEAAGAYDSVYIVVVFDGQEFTYNVPLFEGAHVFEHRVAPKYMGEALKITAYGVKGEEVIPGVTVEWSIKDGIMERLAKFYPYIKYEQYKNRCILLVDMLYYGAEAQVRFGTNGNGLVTDGLDAGYAALKTATEPTIEKVNTATKTSSNQLYQVNLGVEDAVQMQFTFRLKVEDYSQYVVKITANGTTYEYTGESFIPQGDTSTLKKFVTVVFDKLEAVNMRDEITVELWQNGAKVSDTYTMSIEGFATASIANNQNVALLKAMITYGDSAKVSLG